MTETEEIREKMKHTSGPWNVVERSGSGVQVEWGDEPNEVRPVCVMRWTDGLRPEVEERVSADAHLIAAAPDMLAMLQKILSGIERGKLEDQTLLMRDGEEVVTQSLSSRIREIIAKATTQ